MWEEVHVHCDYCGVGNFDYYCYQCGCHKVIFIVLVSIVN